MAKMVNGKATPDPVAIRVMGMHNDLTKAIMALINEHREGKPDELEYNKVAMVALTNVAAIYAVDTGMDGETYMQIAQIQYEGAYQAAPKWS